MFVTDEKIAEIAEEILPHFECGDLHSQSKTSEIARHAKEALADNGLPTRWSLCCVVARVAQMTWKEQVIRCQAARG